MLSEAIVLDLLRTHPAGLTESALLKALGFSELREPLTLFRAHFLLFHTLYALRDRLWRQQTAHLHIDPLCIVLRAYSPGQAALTEPDPLRAYYADLSRLDKMTADAVKELLRAFWRGDRNTQQRQTALSVLELQDPVDYPAIKRQYRRLAMRHHPDRGGDGRRLQALNAALAVLEPRRGGDTDG
jgi:DnaJ-domain-containing protein 1